MEFYFRPSNGRSLSGKFEVENIEFFKCYRMTGIVSTKNNGGFIQIRSKLKPEINTNDYKGIYIKVYGNEKKYKYTFKNRLNFCSMAIL